MDLPDVRAYARCDCGHAISQLSEARWLVNEDDGPMALLCLDCYEEITEPGWQEDNDSWYDGYQADVADFGGAS